jgi:cbb3-type cytochrome oxidase subunit 1/mono/diheme cytochrome c family protein
VGEANLPESARAHVHGNGKRGRDQGAVTAEVSHDNSALVSEAATSSQQVVRHHLAASLGFLVVGAVLLALAAAQYVAPDLLAGWAPLTYGRLRPAAIHFLLYGWLTLGLLGTMYYAVPRLSGASLVNPTVARIGFIFTSVGYGLGGLAILLGQSGGVRYLEAPPWTDLLVLIGLLAAAHSIARTVVRGDRNRSPAAWFMLAAVLWLVGLHFIGNLDMVTTVGGLWRDGPVLHGIDGAILAGFYRAGIIGLWGASAGVGLVYFLVPRLVGLRTFRPTRMSLVGFWGLGLVWSFTGSAELTYTAVPDWLETIGVVFSLALVLPVATIIVDVMNVVRERRDDVTEGNRVPLSLIGAGMAFFAAVPVLNLVEALRASGGVVGFTDWVFGVEVFALLGALGCWLLAYVYHVIPATTTAGAARVRRWHLDLTVIGVVVGGFAMLVGGLATGLTWAAGGEAGTLTTAGNGFKSAVDAVHYLGLPIFRLVGLGLFAVAQVLLLGYAAIAWAGARRRGDGWLVGDPVVEVDHQDVGPELTLDDHGPGWRRIGWAAVAGAIAVFVLVVVMPAQESSAADPSILADAFRMYPEGSQVAAGRDLYISEGCAVCHSQAVRPIVTDLGLGPVSVAGDYAHEAPVLLGTTRMGPDLMHVGSRGAVAARRLTDPRADRPWSTMPSYDYLSEQDLNDLLAYVNGLK